MNRTNRSRQIAEISLLLALMAIIQILSTTIFSLFPLPIKPTIVHIPVIVASIIYGPKIGAYLGGFMGILSMITNTIVPSVTNYLFSPFVPNGNFWSLIIAIVPRILIGITPYLIYKLIHNKLGLVIAGVIGSFTNTLFVLLGIFVFFSEIYNGSIMALLGAVITSNSIAEMIIAAFLVSVIVLRFKKD